MNSNINATKTPLWRRQRDLPIVAPHCMAWHVSGNPEGQPWLLLHGGPGSGAHVGLTAPLDLRRHWAIAPDQRGSGLSRPRGAIRRNHTALLVADLEHLRRHLGIERWCLLAGSWGTVLALAYAQAHPERVGRLVLRGAFALSHQEIGGLLLGPRSGKTPRAMRDLWPPSSVLAWPVLLGRLGRVFQRVTPGVAALCAARHWSALEAKATARGMWRALLHANGPATSARSVWASQRRRARRAAAGFQRRASRADRSDRTLCAKFRIQAHYLSHRGFMQRGQLDRAVKALARSGTPVDWVHGRFDSVCQAANSQRWSRLASSEERRQMTLTLTVAGHLGHEPSTLAALRRRVGGV